ncbi:MAG: DUF5916 domain-containing protein [Congregibacter sp.]
MRAVLATILTALSPIVATVAIVPGLHAAPGDRPSLRAERLSIIPTLDGKVLDDQAWSGMRPATGFRQIQPDEGRPASQRTEVFVGFTDDTLYVAVIAHDTDPDAIVASDSRRDASLDDSDSFRMIIDGFKDRQNGLVFGTNPAGMQYDGQLVKESTGFTSASGSGFNLNWDAPWEVASSIGEHGWSAEFQIPFRSLRYGGADRQEWGINFQRNIRRNNNEIVFWAPLDRQFSILRVYDAGILTGVEPPPQRSLLVTPYALARIESEDIEGTNRSEEFGVDIKYSVTPSLTLDLTYNTDFAQVEVDDLQVNLNRFSLFFPEKRPFFLENAGQYTVGTPQEVEFFFSRRVGIDALGAPTPIVGGARLSGKIGQSTNVGLLHMQTEDVPGEAPQNDFSVVRVNRELANRSSFGAVFVNRDGDGSLLPEGQDDYNRTYGFDGRLGFGDYGTVSGWAGKTDTPGLTGDDYAYNVRVDYDSPRWSNNLAFTEVSEDFNPEVGFLNRDDYRKIEGRVLYRYRPDNVAGLLELRPHVSYRGWWDLDGEQETGFLHLDNHFEWRSSLEIHTGMNFTYERVKEPFELTTGVEVPVGEYDNSEVQLVFQSNEGRALYAEVTSVTGGFFNGERQSLRPTVRYRIGETFSTELAWNYNRIDLPSEGSAFTINAGQLRVSYSFTPKVLLQALFQYDDRSDRVGMNLRFSVLQRANAGLFVVYNEVDEMGFRKPRREFALKYSRILDVLR